MTTTKKPSKRSKTPVRFAVVILSVLLTGAVFQKILDGPPPAHTAPTVVAVVQQAPSLDAMVNQVESQASNNSGGGFTAMAAPQPRFQTRGS